MTSNFLMKSIRVAALAAVTLLPAMACTYSASTPAPVGSGGGNTTVQIYTQPGCPWQVTSSAGWLQLFLSRSGSGPGTAYVYLTPNEGAARQNYINVVVYSGTLSSSFLPTRSAVTGIATIAFRSLLTEY
jgi:hypothetical protein